MIIKFVFFLLVANDISASELNLLCTENSDHNKHLYPRDLIVRINTGLNQIEIGGLKLTPENLILTESNIKWFNANNDNMFGDGEPGLSSGLLGRFSGMLSLEFIKINNNRKSNLHYKCEKFKIRNRRF